MNPLGELILVLDAGTTSTRAMAFGRDGAVRAQAQRELTQYYPQPGWVEHDAAEIWEATLACARQVVTEAGGADRIACLGITNQRETVVAWDRKTLEPLHRALVWQDRRTADACAALREAGREPTVQVQTGLLLDPYFSATKMRWLIENSVAVRAASAAGRLALGTVETWLVAKLTGGLHISDASNASRTSLLQLGGAKFNEGLCDLFAVPRADLAEVVDNAGPFGKTEPGLLGGAIAITGLVGDQQSATIGQGCLAPGETKATYGTGAFVLANMGSRMPHSRSRLLGTVLCQLGGERSYALEGSIFVAGSLIKWLRDSLKLISSTQETEAAGPLGAGQRRGRRRARAFGPGRAALAARGARYDHRHEFRHDPRPCRPRRARSHGHADPRSRRGFRRRRCGLDFAQDRRRHERQRLDGAGPCRHPPAAGGAARFRGDYGAGGGDAGGAGGWDFRFAGRSRLAMRGGVEHFAPAMGQSERAVRLEGGKRRWRAYDPRYSTFS